MIHILSLIYNKCFSVSVSSIIHFFIVSFLFFIFIHVSLLVCWIIHQICLIVDLFIALFYLLVYLFNCITLFVPSFFSGSKSDVQASNLAPRELINHSSHDCSLLL